MKHKAFTRPDDLYTWLQKNHEIKTELWIRLFKKRSGQPSVIWNECVIEAIAWGWIDGQKKSLDDLSYLQRLTPRQPKSSWSKKNKEHAKRLISGGRMQPPGLLHIKEAMKDGCWDAAYEGSAGMKIPQDFLDTLKKDKKAMFSFKTLDRKHLYLIYYQLATAKTPETPETRSRRLHKMIGQLSKEEKFY